VPCAFTKPKELPSRVETAVRQGSHWVRVAEAVGEELATELGEEEAAREAVAEGDVLWAADLLAEAEGVLLEELVGLTERGTEVGLPEASAAVAVAEGLGVARAEGLVLGDGEVLMQDTSLTLELPVSATYSIWPLQVTLEGALNWAQLPMPSMLPGTA
jgi:hypothetical protein